MGNVSSKQPLYDQLADLLRQKIEGEMAPGTLLPSERELSERYGLSRTTVRQAMAELESQGLVVRQHGRGTFVADLHATATNLMTSYSFTESMKAQGRTPRTETLDFDIREANRYVAEHLRVHLGAAVYRIRRLRLADEVPMMVECTYLPVSQFVSLTREDVQKKPLYDLIEQDYHVHIHKAVEEFFASIVHPRDAEVLGLAEGAPVLRLQRTTVSDRNRVIEYTHSAARADQFKYKVSHVR